MGHNNWTSSHASRYCKILGLPERAPGFDALTEIIRKHLEIIPFENISKHYYKKRDGLQGLLPPDQYLEGIEQNHFGGTCYVMNYYLHLLLKHLGYDISLCGADMSKPDVHIVNIVRLGGREYIVDVGYAAPFLQPLPRDLNEDIQITLGNDRYVLKPQNEKKQSIVELYRDGVLKHGYTVNPLPRHIEEFTDVIADSFRDTATFMNAILLVKFMQDTSCVVHNMTFITSAGVTSERHTVHTREELTSLINLHFGIPLNIIQEVLANVMMERDAWG